MRFTKITVLCLFVFFNVAACLCFAEDNISSDKTSVHQNIYYFQHRLLPKWTFESQGAFFDDLMNGNLDKLIQAASEIVGDDFSQRIIIKKYDESNGVLLTFPAPQEPPECFFIYIFKRKDGFRFYTYENTIDLFGSGVKGAVCEWSEDRTHKNWGSRNYNDSDSFVSELQNK